MLISWDERRDLNIGGSEKETLKLALEHWLSAARSAIAASGHFAVALSGGSTPKALFEALSLETNALDWTKVWLFWSDERAALPDNPESNYHMAMTAGFSRLPILPQNIFRMKAESDLEKHALEYEELVKQKLGGKLFDLVMLGVGEDGHTASLFPETAALHITDRLIVPNHVIQKNTWRMTCTFPCINHSKHSVIYALGSSKQEIVNKVLRSEPSFALPASLVGTPLHKTLWILDRSASKALSY